MISRLARLFVLLLPSVAGAGTSADELDRLLEGLASRDPGAYAETLAALESLGEEAALRALETFDESDFRERRARARLLVKTVSPACVDGTLRHLTDPDPLVRRLFCRALGALPLGGVAGAARATALGERAREDPNLEVRREAVSSLSKSGLPEAVTVLDRLLDELPEPERPHVAHGLAGLSPAGARLCARVQRAFSDSTESFTSEEVLAILLDAYGKALVDLPGGGERPAERAPLVLGRQHPAREVGLAAGRALDRAMARLVEFGELERADTLLALLGADGLDPREMHYRRANLALTETGDELAALDHARSLQLAALAAPAEEAGRWTVFGEVYESVALFAAGELQEARAGFERTAERLEHLVAERPDLRPYLTSRERTRFGGSLLVDRLQLAAVVELWRALIYVEETGTGEDARGLRHLRQAHVLLLRARVAGERNDSPIDSSSFDAILLRNLAPHSLLLSRSKLARFQGGRGLELAQLLARGLASVSRHEMPGFEPYEVRTRELAEPLLDSERRELLARLRGEELRALQRRWDELRRSDVRDRAAEGRLLFRMRELRGQAEREDAQARVVFQGGEATSAELASVFSGLLRYLRPSGYVLNLADLLRIDGRPTESRRIARRALADFASGLPGSNSAWNELQSARLELAIGSTLMDEGRPREAEEACLAAAGRLEAFENTLLEIQRSSPGAVGIQAQLRQTKNMRANVLLSLAVNANVRMEDPERALGFFEQAYELDQREFMRVLLACYRARSGRAEEARAVLVGVEPAPALYYNLACTYALLGDADASLDFLQRDFQENHRSQGSRQRQVEWAREDPDLASLRDDPRFARLLNRALER